MSVGRVVFGGPDCRPRRLRDLLQAEIESVPAGGRIDWATYYFRDRELAQALVTAQERGVDVRLVMEAQPRLEGTNDAVIEHLANGQLSEFCPRRWWPGRLHSKIYAFSHPDRCWLGSFNPSGGEPENMKVIEEIGDQDRGDNLLVEITAPTLVDAARQGVSALARSTPLLSRFDPNYPKYAAEGGTDLYFFPRMSRTPLLDDLKKAGAGDCVQAAMSHLKPGPLVDRLENAAARGARVRLIVHATERRVPPTILERQREKGIEVTRVGDGSAAPMHAKMLLLRTPAVREVWFGSYNSNFRSRYLNAEVLVRSRSAALFHALEARFREFERRS